MWNWIKNVGNGISNIFSGKSWNGDDPSKIKQDAEDALRKQKDEYDALIGKYQSSLESASQKASSSKTMLIVAGGIAVLVVGYVLLNGNRRGYRR